MIYISNIGYYNFNYVLLLVLRPLAADPMKSNGIGIIRSIPSSTLSTLSFTNCLRGTFKPVLPGFVSKRRSVPAHILSPEYAKTGVPLRAPNQIALYHGQDLQKVDLLSPLRDFS